MLPPGNPPPTHTDPWALRVNHKDKSLNQEVYKTVTLNAIDLTSDAKLLVFGGSFCAQVLDGADIIKKKYDIPAHRLENQDINKTSTENHHVQACAGFDKDVVADTSLPTASARSRAQLEKSAALDNLLQDIVRKQPTGPFNLH